MQTLHAILLVPQVARIANLSPAEVLIAFAQGEISSDDSIWREGGNHLVFGDRKNLLQGEILRIFLFIVAFPLSKDLLRNLFTDAKVRDRKGAFESLELQNVDEDFLKQAAPIDIDQLTTFADIIADKAKTDGNGSSALSGQLWEVQAFPCGMEGETLVTQSIPIRAGKVVVAALFEMKLAVTAVRNKFEMPLSLKVSLLCQAHSAPVVSQPVTGLTLSSRGEHSGGEDASNDRRLTKKATFTRLPSTRDVPNRATALRQSQSMLRTALVDQDGDNYGQLDAFDHAVQPAATKKSLIKLYTPVTVLRPLKLTTTFLGQSLFVKVENASKEFNLLIEAVHTRATSCYLGDVESILPALLGPDDQYCINLEMQSELVSTQAVKGGGSKTVFPITIKWRINEQPEISTWSQFGADCQAPQMLPVEVQYDDLGCHNANGEDGDLRLPYTKKIRVTVLNRSEEPLDLFLVAASTDLTVDPLEISQQNRKAGSKPRISLNSRIRGLHIVPYMVALRSTHDIGIVEPGRARHVLIDYHVGASMSQNMLPPLYIVDCGAQTVYQLSDP